MSSPAPPRQGAALEYTQKVLGGPTVETDKVVSVPNSVTIAVDGNGDRVGLIFVNLGTSDIFINIDPAVSSTNGIDLTSNGGSATLSVVYDFTLVTRRWYAIAAAAGPFSLLVIEYSRFSYSPSP